MARRLDALVVVDVEATCWDGDPPPGQQPEIIEIGVCLVRVDTGDRSQGGDIFVRPAHSEVSPFCTDLTTITPDQASAGISFADACRVLARDYKTRDRGWASWGDYDRRLFERQCAAESVPYPFGPGHLNVKTLFALAYQLDREVGMDAALMRLGLPLHGTHHRAGDDALNIATILASLLARLRA